MIIRVFPRKTNGTPDDNLAFIGMPDLIAPEINAKEVHISVTFTKDKSFAENKLAKAWEKIAPVKIDGPAYDNPGGEFEPGMYLKKGYVITSRGCPNKCWFCDVHKRSGDLKEYPIKDGWNIQDDNFLACSKKHIQNVFKMLQQQKEKGHPITFDGGLEAKLLKHWHIELLWNLRPSQMFFAYDTPDDYEPLREASKLLRYAAFTYGMMRCYVLIGYPKDTIDKALKRLLAVWKLGYLPFAMLYMNKKGEQNPKWKKFTRTWSRPAATKTEIKRLFFNRKKKIIIRKKK